MNINIMTKNRAVHWKTSYDEEYARYSPGNLLFREFLSDCVRNNFTEIDFLSPATPNKKFWATGEREHAAFYVFQPGLLGLMHWKWKFSVIKRLRKYKAGIAF
jgi:CelD/BcsL family acetyltransferase involved in cellulose biosynthesis